MKEKEGETEIERDSEKEPKTIIYHILWWSMFNIIFCFGDYGKYCVLINSMAFTPFASLKGPDNKSW